jgi:putative NADH-flavin reductase
MLIRNCSGYNNFIKEICMKIALFGATGTIGQRITQEALNRGHKVTAIVRNPASVQIAHPNLTTVKGDALDPASVAQTVAGQDVVVSAVGPKRDGSSGTDFTVNVAHSLIEGLTRAGVSRLLVVGGAGSLEVAPGVLLFDTPDFPAAWRPGAKAAGRALEVYKTANLDWTYFSPANLITPGERTGKYRLGTDQLVTDKDGKSYISAEDYAVALVDEIEKPQFIRRRFTAAY